MKRFLVFALIAALGPTSLAYAEGSLLGSATRIAQRAARADSTRPVPAAARMDQGSQSGLASSGMSRKKKFWIVLAAGIGFGAAVYTIDHRVEDNTTSSRGLRKD